MAVTSPVLQAVPNSSQPSNLATPVFTVVVTPPPAAPPPVPPPSASLQSSRQIPSTNSPFAAAPQKTTDRGYLCKLKLCFLKLLKPDTFAPLLVGTIIGAIGTVYAQTGNEMNAEAFDLAKWTAKKDFREQCQQSEVCSSPTFEP